MKPGPMKRTLKTSLLAGLALSLALTACGDDRSGAAAVAPPPRKPAPAPVVAAAEKPLLYAYNPTAKRDPFRSPVADMRATSPSNSACADPLCQYELDQLTLVAVVTGDANPLAMVEDPQGRGYMVRRNARMGRQGGRVTQILRDSITVTELFTGPDGKVTPNPVSVGLKPDTTAKVDIDFLTGKPYP
jgi:type IV pilus assembly protein PilP